MDIGERKKGRENPLDGKFIIVDEVHNFTTSVINPDAANSSQVYDLIMDAKDPKLLFLSGTPILGEPFSVCPLFNMLRGKLYEEGEKDPRNYYTVFPELASDFEGWFINWKTNKMINRYIFQERIVGLVSYYQGVQDPSIMPEMLALKVMRCEMSPHQWRVYSHYRLMEIREEQVNILRKEKFVEQLNKKASRESSSTYKQKSRMACNFALPESLHKPKFKQGMDHGVKEAALRKILTELGPKELSREGLGRFSNKFRMVLEEAESEAEGIVQVFSEFVALEGLGILGKVFRLDDWTEVKLADLLDKKDIPGEKFKRFITISGEVPQKDRSKLLKRLNDMEENPRGELIRVLMMSMVGAEGINLKGVRKSIAVEPYWHWTKINQIFARARRHGSHMHLKPEERNVQPILFLSVPPQGTSPMKDLKDFDDLSTDEHIYQRSRKKWALIEDILGTMRESAFDCDLNWEDNKGALPSGACKKCQEVSEKIKETKKMFEANIRKHMIPGNSFCYPKELRIVRKKEKWIDVESGIEYVKKDGKWIPAKEQEEIPQEELEW